MITVMVATNASLTFAAPEDKSVKRLVRIQIADSVLFEEELIGAIVCYFRASA